VAFTNSNTIVASDVNVLGLQVHFRPGTTTSAAVIATATAITVDNVNIFAITGAGSTFTIDDGTLSETGTITAIVGSVLTVGALTNPYAAGTTIRWDDFIDLGHVQNPSRAVDVQENEIQSAREGRLQTIKKLTTSISKSITIETMTTTDDDVAMLHRGRQPKAGGAIGTFIPDDVTPVNGETLLIHKNAETGGQILVEFRPSSQIAGTDFQGGDGENVALRVFEITVLTLEGYTIPAALDTDESPASLGFEGWTTTANLTAVLDAIAG